MPFRISLLGFLFFLLVSSSSFGTELAQECAAFPAPLPGRYCIWKTPGSRNRDVVYHLHGAGLSELVWGEADFYPAMIRTAWDGMHRGAPTVVSISFGPAWALVPKNASPASGLLEVFIQRVIPFIENKLGGLKGRRLLLGESMGGFNATATAMLAGKYFNKVAMLCPALVNFSPYADDEIIKAYIARTGADPKLVERIKQIGQAFIPNDGSWEKISPITLMENSQNKRYPLLYLSCGTSDEYGFMEGSQLFEAAARKARVWLEWHPVWHGGHCAPDISSLAAFLMY